MLFFYYLLSFAGLPGRDFVAKDRLSWYYLNHLLTVTKETSSYLLIDLKETLFLNLFIASYLISSPY
jgi:hypothetical protein